MNEQLVRPLRLSDYSLVGKDTALAIEKGLAEATWYTSPVPKEKMRELLERRDGPPSATRCSGLACWSALGSGATCSGARGGPSSPLLSTACSMPRPPTPAGTRSGHGTAFKTDWMNNVALRDRLVHGAARIDPSGAGATPATTATRSSSGATRRSPCRARRTCCRCSGAFFNLKAGPKYFRTRAAALHGPAHARGAHLHPGVRVRQGDPAGAHLRADLRGGDRAGHLPRAASCR